MALGTLAQLTEEDTERAFSRGATLLELTLTLPDTASLTISRFGEAMDALAECYPLLKVSILKAMAAVAADDGDTSDTEMTLVRAMAAVMDCPAPDAMLEATALSRARPRIRAKACLIDPAALC